MLLYVSNVISWWYTYTSIGVRYVVFIKRPYLTAMAYTHIIWNGGNAYVATSFKLNISSESFSFRLILHAIYQNVKASSKTVVYDSLAHK